MPYEAVIARVFPGSPFDDAGFEPGCRIVSINNIVLRDIIDWRWYSDTDTLQVSYIDTDGEAGCCEVLRDEGEDWGLEFQEALFDGTMQCRNACTFCFMRQLPDDSRDSLKIRDDDYRLSFLQGTFVTFTNLRQSDVQRIIEQHISPLRYSLHAVTPSVREYMIGKHASRGIEVAEELLSCGIELHTQIVLVPGQNDGEELRHTLEWAYAHPGILSVGIVPVGYTKHQTAFSESFGQAERAQAVIEAIAPFQHRAMQERGIAWVHASDEFYRNAYPHNLLDKLPSAQVYGSFDLFEDGIGIVRSFVDDFRQSISAQKEALRSLNRVGCKVAFVCGCAQREFFTPLLEEARLSDVIQALYVENDYFGGNVDVTGLLCGCDIAPALQTVRHADADIGFAVIPDVVFNADGVTLDQMTCQQIEQQAGCPVHVVSCQASEFLVQIAHIADQMEAG